MFIWNVEEMKLLNEKCVIYNGDEKVYDCESKTSKEDKIAFIDKMNSGRMSCIIDLINKLEEAQKDMPKDNWGNVKTVAFKAWMKKNDILGLCEEYADYKYIYFLNVSYPISLLSSQDERNYYIDKMFHVQLIKCEQMESQYFKKHDEYEILKQKLRDKNHEYGISFGVNIGLNSNGHVYVYDDNWSENTRRDITIDELKLLLKKYAELDLFVDKISKEINIKY